MPSASDREKALDTALAQIDRQFGKGSVMRLGSDERAPVEVIPTGSIALDAALGTGGLTRGRIVEIYGPSLPVRQPLPYTPLPTPSALEELLRSSTPSTPWTPNMPRRSALISMLCW